MRHHWKHTCSHEGYEDSLGPDPWEPYKPSTRKYECASCGDFDVMGYDNEKFINKDGVRELKMICDRCLRLGFDYWGR